MTFLILPVSPTPSQAKVPYFRVRVLNLVRSFTALSLHVRVYSPPQQRRECQHNSLISHVDPSV